MISAKTITAKIARLIWASGAILAMAIGVDLAAAEKAPQSSTVLDHLWIWTHPVGAHDGIHLGGGRKGKSRMSPVEGAAHLLAKEGITVNAIAPALIETEMVTGNPNARPDLIPVGRFGTVEETAEVALMLARNGYITGQTVSVNGGWYMT